MSVEKFNSPRLFLSEEAKKHIKKMLAQKPSAKGIRFGVNKTGCNGYGYILEFEETGSNLDDEVINLQGIDFFVDKKIMPMIAGTHIKVEEVGVNFQFKFSNPNAKNECGCGESFAF